MEATATAMETLLSNISSVVTSAMGWAGDVVTFITAPGHELVELFVITAFVGLGVGLLRRMIRI